MRRMAVTLLLAGLAGTMAWGDDCATCKPGKVCATHEAEDEVAIKEGQAKLKDKDNEERRAGLDRMAAAASKHLNARSKKITAEFVRVLSDADASVKNYAADKLVTVGDEATAVQALTADLAKLEKALPKEKPAKEADLPKWESSIDALGGVYRALGKLAAQAGTAATVDRGLRSANPWVASVAAESCKHFKNNKVILKALVDMLAKYFSQNVTDGNSAAWRAISLALPVTSGHTEIPVQKDGADAARWNAEWQKWWRATEKSLK